MTNLPARRSGQIRFVAASFAATILAASLFAAAASTPRSRHPTEVQSVKADPQVTLAFGDEHLVLEGGLQPSMVGTSTGTLVVQAQTIEKPHPSKRISYPSAVETVVSRDGGKTWENFPRPAGENGLNLEGGALQLRSGRIVALDTYVPPADDKVTGAGQLYVSDDDWRTLRGPIASAFQIPDANFRGSSDDYGRSHDALRLHRRILELPNGDLLTTLYGWLNADSTPATYLPTMKKSRAMLLRSSDEGRSWRYVSTIAVDPQVGTEGFAEPVLARISQGPNAGRLRCYMRTGHELYETWSDDDGRTWQPARPINFGFIDIHRTQDWAPLFRDVKDKEGKPIDLTAAVVDPDLLELRSGILCCAFGMRIPGRASWPHAEYPGNGNYLAFSFDHGATWLTVVRMTSGVLTTHYMAVVESPRDNELFVAYDLGDWSSGHGRNIYGRTVKLSVAK